VTFNEFAAKKVLGVPVLYVVGAAVIILAIVAWKLKPAAGSTQAEEAPADAADTEKDIPDPYDGFETQGTVVVSPTPTPAPDPNLSNQSITTDSQWITRGINLLVQDKGVSGTEAAAALNKYLNDQDRTYDENDWVNYVIKQLGPPPDGGGGGGGTVGAKPATKQFTTPPGTHTIQGGTDNSYGALAALYYNSSAQDRIDLLQAANVAAGKAGPWPTGTKITIPAYHPPKYYKVPAGGETADTIVKKNGLTLQQLGVLNLPGDTSYKGSTRWPGGTQFRVA
jgi:hypothetical protein